LDNFDGPTVREIAVGAELYEEVLAIFKKFRPCSNKPASAATRSTCS